MKYLLETRLDLVGIIVVLLFPLGIPLVPAFVIAVTVAVRIERPLVVQLAEFGGEAVIRLPAALPTVGRGVLLHHLEAIQQSLPPPSPPRDRVPLVELEGACEPAPVSGGLLGSPCLQGRWGYLVLAYNPSRRRETLIRRKIPPQPCSNIQS